MLKSLSRTVLCAAIALSAAVPALAQPVELDWKFEPGSTHKYRTEVTQNQTISGAQFPQPMKVSQKTGLDVSYEVLGVEDGVATIKVTTDAVRMHMTNAMMGMDTKYDSTVDDQPPATLEPLESLIGTNYSVSIDPTGKVTKVEGVAELLEKLTQGGNPMAGQMLGAMLNEDAIKTQFEQQFRLLPENPVGEGDTWATTTGFPLPGVGALSVKTNYTYKGDSQVADASDHVAFDGQAEFKGEQNGQFDVSLEQSDISGSFDFSRGLGQLVRLEQTLDMILNVQQGGMDLKVEMAQVTKLSRLD